MKEFIPASSHQLDFGNPSSLQIAADAAFSIEMWIRSDDPDGATQHLFGPGFSTTLPYYLDMGSGGIRIGSFDGTNDNKAEGTTSWSPGSTHHFYGGYTGTNWEIWLDGSQLVSTADTGPLAHNGANFFLGYLGGVGRYFDGAIGEFAVRNVFLSAGEINALAKGFSSDMIRRTSLRCYLPLVRDVNDRFGKVPTVTDNAGSFSNHVKILRPIGRSTLGHRRSEFRVGWKPTPPMLRFLGGLYSADAPGGSSIPNFMWHYQQQRQW